MPIARGHREEVPARHHSRSAAIHFEFSLFAVRRRFPSIPKGIRPWRGRGRWRGGACLTTPPRRPLRADAGVGHSDRPGTAVLRRRDDHGLPPARRWSTIIGVLWGFGRLDVCGNRAARVNLPLVGLSLNYAAHSMRISIRLIIMFCILGVYEVAHSIAMYGSCLTWAWSRCAEELRLRWTCNLPPLRFLSTPSPNSYPLRPFAIFSPFHLHSPRPTLSHSHSRSCLLLLLSTLPSLSFLFPPGSPFPFHVCFSALHSGATPFSSFSAFPFPFPTFNPPLFIL